jgi:hypothetical protein
MLEFTLMGLTGNAGGDGNGLRLPTGAEAVGIEMYRILPRSDDDMWEASFLPWEIEIYFGVLLAGSTSLRDNLGGTLVENVGRNVGRMVGPFYLFLLHCDFEGSLR